MSYKDLQNEARGLGIKYVGVSASKLRRAIEQKKAEGSSEKAVETPKEMPQEAPHPENESSNKKANVAVIKNEMKQEIRRYTLEIHGEKFASLAHQFANDRDYDVELIEVTKKHLCPNCGHELESVDS